MPKIFSPSKMFLKKNFAHENMKKPASKVAHNQPSPLFFSTAQIQPNSQFLFDKNLPPRDFSIITLLASIKQVFLFELSHKMGVRNETKERQCATKPELCRCCGPPAKSRNMLFSSGHFSLR